MIRAILEGRKTQTRRLSPRWAKLKKGDRLLVKECWRYGRNNFVYYRATDSELPACQGPLVKWKPSLFMPRSLVRIELEATADAYQEPLQDISEEDAEQEVGDFELKRPVLCTYRTAFAHLWNSINRKPGIRWLDNPSPYVIRFRRTKP